MLFFRGIKRCRHAVGLISLFFAGLIPALAGQLGNFVVIGDSLSAGLQNGTLRGCQQLRGYANLIANQAGSPLVLPLIADPGIPPGAARINPSSQVTDLAVPGQTVQQALSMRPNFATFPVAPEPVQTMTNFVLGFPGVFVEPLPVSRSQVEWANALSPDTVVIWLGANDAIGIFQGLQSGITDPVAFGTNLQQVLSALVANNRKILIANIPDVTLLPFMVPFLHANPTLGPALKSIVLAYNSAIQELASRRGIPVVDIYSLVNDLAAKGVVVHGQRLTTENMGGLFSFDGVHPSDTGYAVVANEFIKTMNRRFGTDIPPVNLVKVADDDPFIPGSNAPLCTSGGPTDR
jgi:lysophospholipase L1-like esterase